MLLFCSVGINSFSADKVRKIILAGADILRYNFSYRHADENIGFVEIGKKVIDELNSSARILIDLPNRNARLGNFDLRLFAVRENEEFTFQSATFSPDCNQFIPVRVAHLGQKVRPNQTIIIGDGEIAIQVLDILNADAFRGRVLNNGIIEAGRGTGILQNINETKYLENLQIILRKIKTIGPHFIALPYIDPEINQKIQEMEIFKNWDVKKIIKIENETAINNLTNICQNPFYDNILLDRGELGVNMPFAKLAIMQKTTIDTSHKYKKPIIVSTHILDSTMNNLVPARSEISDLTYLVWQGASGIMLCRETSVGLRPAYTISVAKKIIEEAEKNRHLAAFAP